MKRFVYDYCHTCHQATPHQIIVEVVDFGLLEVKAKCEWCGNIIEVEWIYAKAKTD